ncbi:MAG TPA: CDP-alcohol phosphatidyltransferase family protein [Actinomycetota bacterium]
MSASLRVLVRARLADSITAARVCLAIALPGLVDVTAPGGMIAGLGLMAFIFLLDGVDGIVARRLGTVTQFGSFLDILGDRLVEFVFIWRFTQDGVMPGWLPVPFYVRILVTDVCRVAAYRAGHMGARGIHLEGRARSLVLSRTSRTGYGLAKLILFACCFVNAASPAIAVAAVGVLTLSVVRGLPLVATYLPTVVHSLRSLVGAGRRGDGRRPMGGRLALLQVSLDCLALAMVSGLRIA